MVSVFVTVGLSRSAPQRAGNIALRRSPVMSEKRLPRGEPADRGRKRGKLPLPARECGEQSR